METECQGFVILQRLCLVLRPLFDHMFPVPVLRSPQRSSEEFGVLGQGSSPAANCLPHPLGGLHQLPIALWRFIALLAIGA